MYADRSEDDGVPYCLLHDPDRKAQASEFQRSIAAGREQVRREHRELVGVDHAAKRVKMRTPTEIIRWVEMWALALQEGTVGCDEVNAARGLAETAARLHEKFVVAEEVAELRKAIEATTEREGLQ